MANSEKLVTDRLKATYNKGEDDIFARKAIPLEVWERVLTVRNELEKPLFTLLVDHDPSLKEDVRVKGNLPDRQNDGRLADEERLFLTRVESIFEKVLQWPGFPYQYCDRAAFFLAKRIKEVQVAIGWFRLDQPVGLYLPGWSKPIEPHSWNIDKKGRIIDLTAFQFNEGLDYPLPPRPLVIEGDCFYANRYRKVTVIENINPGGW